MTEFYISYLGINLSKHQIKHFIIEINWNLYIFVPVSAKMCVILVLQLYIWYCVYVFVCVEVILVAC